MSSYPSLTYVPADRPDQQAFFDGVRETLEGITGKRQNEVAITQLPSTATPEQIIAALNQIISRLNG